MLKRHQDQLMSRLDELYCRGTTFIAWSEIYHWYGLERIVKAPYRDIQDRWKGLMEEAGHSKPADPFVTVDERGGISLFYSDKPQRLSKLAE